ncbi:sensor domain-containing protein, partial [Nocardioides sp. CER28]
MSTVTAVAPTEIAGRLRLTLYAGAEVLLTVPTLVALVVTIVGGVLSITWIGLLFLVWSVPMLHWLADRHRAMAAHTLGVPV